MYLADEGLQLRSDGQYEAALRKFEEAFEFELKVAEETAEESQPGHGVLHRSAAVLALDANRLDAARQLIDQGLRAGAIASVREELKALKDAVEPTVDERRRVTSVEAFVRQVLEVLARFYDDLTIEVARSGRVVQDIASLVKHEREEVFVYLTSDDLPRWKLLDAGEALPPRIWLSGEESSDSEGDELAKIRVELHGTVLPKLKSIIRELFAPPDLFASPVSPLGWTPTREVA